MTDSELRKIIVRKWILGTGIQFLIQKFLNIAEFLGPITNHSCSTVCSPEGLRTKQAFFFKIWFQEIVRGDFGSSGLGIKV